LIERALRWAREQARARARARKTVNVDEIAKQIYIRMLKDSTVVKYAERTYEFVKATWEYLTKGE